MYSAFRSVLLSRNLIIQLINPAPDLIIEIINSSVHVFVDAQENHVVDGGTDQNDRQTLVDTRLRHSRGRLSDFLGLAKQHTLGASLAGVKRVGLFR